MPNKLLSMKEITEWMQKQIEEMRKEGLTDKQIKEVIECAFAPLHYGKM